MGLLVFLVTHPEWLILGPLRLVKWLPTYANWALARIGEHARVEISSWFLMAADPDSGPLSNSFAGSWMENSSGQAANLTSAFTHLALVTAEQQRSLQSLHTSQWMWASLCAVGTTLGALLGSRIHR